MIGCKQYGGPIMYKPGWKDISTSMGSARSSMTTCSVERRTAQRTQKGTWLYVEPRQQQQTHFARDACNAAREVHAGLSAQIIGNNC